jgi:hypothetical protein
MTATMIIIIMTTTTTPRLAVHRDPHATGIPRSLATLAKIKKERID